MKILVTGATGFVGSHLIESLNELGYSVRVLVRPSTQRSLTSQGGYDYSVDVVYGDITNAESVKNALKEADVVFHLAALLGRWQVPESEYYRVNVHGTQVLLDQCLEANIEYFLFLSTTGVMGRLKKIPADVHHPCSPTSLYEKTKYQAELLVRDATNRNGFPATVVRPSHIYGPRDNNTLKLFRMIKSSRLFPLIGGGQSLFQPLYVEDLVKALILCMKKREITAKELYIIAGNEKITFKDFIDLSASIMDTQIMTFNVPTYVAWPISHINEHIGLILNREPRLTRSRVEFFVRNHVYDTEKIRRDLRFAPEVDIGTGLHRTIRLYEERELL